MMPAAASTPADLDHGILARALPRRPVRSYPAGPVVTGRAVGVLSDGALVLRTERDHLVPVRPQNLGLLETV